MLSGVTEETQEISQEVTANDYPVMDEAMFRRYAVNRIAAARALNGNSEQLDSLESKIDNLFHHDDFAAFRKAKEERENFFQGAKGEPKNYSSKAVYQLRCHEVETRYKQEFDSTYKSAIKKMQDVNRILAHSVDPKKDPASVIKKINSKADDLRAKQARPIQHNSYHVKDVTVTSSHIPEGWLTDEQQKLFKQVHEKDAPQDRPHTSPSTIRDKRQVGQANALRTEVSVNGKKTFVGHRHGSPSVLKINNDAQRQHRTLQNVKQMMVLAAQEKIAKGDKTDPLVLDMASMSLLSPVMKGDLLDGMKQYRQVDDSRLAYWSLQGRTIPLKVGEETINVQLNSTFMSIGVNAVRGVGTPAARQLVQRVNNRGLDQLINNVTKQFPSITDPQLKGVANSIQEMESLPEIKNNKQRIADFNREPLNKAYAKLEQCNHDLSDPDFKGNSKAVKKERKSALKAIEKEEKKLDKLHKHLAKAREGIYKNRANDLKKVLTQLQETGNYKDNKDFQKMQVFVDAIDIYYNQPQPGLKRFLDVKRKTSEKNKILKKLTKTNDINERVALREQADILQTQIDALNKSNYRFQARFAVLASQMDQFVEWFCKSGEDRTGLLNEHIEAFCIFSEKYGHAPRWDNADDHVKFHELMPDVHSCAPNRTTNQENDDCPGLKVSDPDFEMPTVSYYTDKKMANVLKSSTTIGLTFGDKVRQFFNKIIGDNSEPNHVRLAKSNIGINDADAVKSRQKPEEQKKHSSKDAKIDNTAVLLEQRTSYTPAATAQSLSKDKAKPTSPIEGNEAKKARRHSNKL